MRSVTSEGDFGTLPIGGAVGGRTTPFGTSDHFLRSERMKFRREYRGSDARCAERHIIRSHRETPRIESMMRILLVTTIV
jgi:hypothetical protein